MTSTEALLIQYFLDDQDFSNFERRLNNLSVDLRHEEDDDEEDEDDSYEDDDFDSSRLVILLP